MFSRHSQVVFIASVFQIRKGSFTRCDVLWIRLRYKNWWCGCQWDCSYGATVMHLCVRCHTWMGSIPILCDCDVWFQYVSIQITVTPCEQFHKIACKKLQSHSERIAPCEQALSLFSVRDYGSRFLRMLRRKMWNYLWRVFPDYTHDLSR